MFFPKGYLVGSGYIGFVQGGKRIMFATEEDYLDYMRGESEERDQ